MNNLRKIGLSALAGSLATFSVNAADVSVSGGASISFDDTNRGKGDRGNGFYMGDSLKFNMSGETDGGLGVAVYYEIDGGALDDYDMTLSGDWGSLKFNGSGSSSAFGAVDDVTPNAYEEAWDIIDDDGAATTGSPTVINGGGGDNMFIYTSPSMGGATLSAAYQNHGGAAAAESYTDFAIALAPEAIEGLSLGLASSNNTVGANIDSDETTMYVTYTVGALSVGYQESEEDAGTAATTDETTSIGISYAVTDDFSVSYGTHTVDYGSTSITLDQESSGFSASYTMGGMTIAGAINSTDNVAGGATSADDKDSYEFNLSFAF